MKHKNKNEKKISKAFSRNSNFAFWSLIITLVIILILSIIALEASAFIKQRPTPFSGILIAFFALFTLFLFFFFYRTKKVNDAIRDLEDATEKVAKGDFSTQIELTNDEDINSFIINFNKMVRELDSMETLKEDFISNVSHEFKTPLAIIQSYSKALRNPNMDKETRERYEKILDDNIKKLTNLTSNILTLSKLENQQLALDKKEFFIDEQIRQCILSCEPDWAKKNIDLQLDLPPTKYYGSEILLEQVWQNLINNAIKFCDDNGKININMSTKAKNIIITIADNGVGIDKTTQEKIFDKFYQGENSRGGNGLGLALVKRILNICDGKIQVVSEPNKGATFTITLPLRHAPVEKIKEEDIEEETE